MDFAWFYALPKDVQEILKGGAANFVGELAIRTTDWIVQATKLSVRKRFTDTPEREAITTAMQQALAVTFAGVTRGRVIDDQLELLFSKWLEDENVQQELSYLLDPSTEAWNWVLLRQAFADAGWSAEDLGEATSFEAIVSELVNNFVVYADKQPALQQWHQLVQLRQMANQLSAVGQSLQAVNTNLQALRQHHPLDLNELEQAYLKKLFIDCNALPLAQDEFADPSRQGPRLQQVYVELLLNRPPLFHQMAQRYAIVKAIPVTAAAAALKAALLTIGAQSEKLQRSGEWQSLQRGLIASQAEEAMLLNVLNSFNSDASKALCEQLEIEEETLRALLHSMTPLEALATHGQIVILGDPGGGKSTLTQRWAALLAAESNEKHFALLDHDERNDLNALIRTLGHWRLPIRIVLNRWAQFLPEETRGTAADLMGECARILGETSMKSERLQEWLLDRAAASSDTLLLLLDGLDEVTDGNKRERMLAAVTDFRKSHSHVPLLITCRVRPYQAWQTQHAVPQTIPVFELAPLTQQAIEQFVQRWYTELQKAAIYQSDRAQQAAGELLTALRSSQRKELREMAGTPLLLTMMARVNIRRGLPNSRAELYKDFVEQLLYEWDRRKQQEGHHLPALNDLLHRHNVLPEALAGKLDELAHELHGQQTGADTVDIPVQLIRGKLAEAHRGTYAERESWSREVLALMVERSGLINVIDTRPHFEIYKFAHRTFQEYLAARYLAGGLDDEMVKQFAAYVDSAEWREVWLLAIGILADVNKQTSRAVHVVLESLPEPAQLPQKAYRAVLLGEAFVEIIGRARAYGFAAKAAKLIEEQLIQLLTITMQHPALPPRQRLDAGLLLAELVEGPVDVDALITIKGWPEVSEKFQIGQYPVTNAQFRRFVGDGGYDDQQWWSEKGLQAKKEYGYAEPRYWDDRDLNRSSQPVVGVSWYEAEAYCNWLTARWRTDNTIAETAIVRLPTRAEWEAAARNKHGKEYPWGADEFDPAHANTKESNLGQTSPVHMYPTGRSSDGVWDLSGNVFEWTNDIHEDQKEAAWQKGGCFWLNKDYAKASAADDSHRWNGINDGGFRVVVVPISR